MSLFLSEGASSKENAVAKIGHEFGHLDDFLSLGNKFYDHQQVFQPYGEKIEELKRKMPFKDLFANADYLRLKQAVIDKTGHEPNALGVIREQRAEAYNIPIIRQLSRSTATLQAARALEKKTPKY